MNFVLPPWQLTLRLNTFFHSPLFRLNEIKIFVPLYLSYLWKMAETTESPFSFFNWNIKFILGKKSHNILVKKIICPWHVILTLNPFQLHIKVSQCISFKPVDIYCVSVYVLLFNPVTVLINIIFFNMIKAVSDSQPLTCLLILIRLCEGKNPVMV